MCGTGTVRPKLLRTRSEGPPLARSRRPVQPGPAIGAPTGRTTSPQPDKSSRLLRTLPLRIGDPSRMSRGGSSRMSRRGPGHEAPATSRLATQASALARTPHAPNGCELAGHDVRFGPVRHRRDHSTWLAKPSTDLRSIRRIGRSKHGFVGSDAATIRARARHDEPRRHGCRFPPALARHVRCESPLAIERADEFVHVDDLGLEFADEERMPLRVPCQEVDHPTFAPDRERDFGRDRPRRPPSLERPGDGFVQRRVACTDEALVVPAAPARLQVEPNVEGRGDPPERIQRNSGRSGRARCATPSPARPWPPPRDHPAATRA